MNHWFRMECQVGEPVPGFDFRIKKTIAGTQQLYIGNGKRRNRSHGDENLPNIPKCNVVIDWCPYIATSRDNNIATSIDSCARQTKGTIETYWMVLFHILTTTHFSQDLYSWITMPDPTVLTQLLT